MSRSDDECGEVGIGGIEMGVIGDKRFCFFDCYSNDDSSSLSYAQCAEFVLRIGDFAARMDAKYAKCEILLDGDYATNKKLSVFGISMFAKDPCVIDWSSRQWSNRRIPPNKTTRS
jgi:hypothetical protein